MKLKRMLCMAVAAVITGCGVGVDDGASPDEKVEVVSREDAITANGWATSTGGKVDLGSDSDRTCFLQGLSGEVRGTRSNRAGGRVFRENGHWYLRAYHGTGSGVKAQATCIPHVYGRMELSWTGDSGNGVFFSENRSWLPRGTTDILTKCFFTEVMADVGFTGTGHYVQLGRQRIYGIYAYGEPYDTWSIGGNLGNSGDADSGGNTAAVCVKLINTHTPYSWQLSGAGGQSGNWFTASDTVCGIQKLTGKFADDSNGGINDGVWLSNVNGWWRAFSSGSKRIEGECHSNY